MVSFQFLNQNFSFVANLFQFKSARTRTLAPNFISLYSFPYFLFYFKTFQVFYNIIMLFKFSSLDFLNLQVYKIQFLKKTVFEERNKHKLRVQFKSCFWLTPGNKVFVCALERSALTVGLKCKRAQINSSEFPCKAEK